MCVYMYVYTLWASLYNFINGLIGGRGTKNYLGVGGDTNDASYDFKGINEYIALQHFV